MITSINIIFTIIWLVLSEALYIWFMDDENNEDGWFSNKILSLMISAIITFLIYGACYITKNYLKEISIVAGISVVIGLFFIINYKLGKAIVKRNKRRRKKRK